MKKLLLVLCLALAAVLLPPSVASASTPTLKSLTKSLATLQRKVNSQATTITAQASTITSLSGRLTTAETKIATLDPTQGATMAALSAKLTADEGTIATLSGKLTAVEVNPVLALGPYVTFAKTDPSEPFGASLTFTGINLYTHNKADETSSFAYYYYKPDPWMSAFRASGAVPAVNLSALGGGMSPTGIRFYRSPTSGGPWTLVADVPGVLSQANEFTDTDVSFGQTYYYTAVAYDAWGVEVRSPEVHIDM